MEDTIGYKTVSKVNNFSSKNKPEDKCINCQSVCACEVAQFYDQKNDLDVKEFVANKILCKNCLKAFKRTYRQGIKQEQLICNFAYYVDLMYEIPLRKMVYEAVNCPHVEDSKLQKKRLETIFQEYSDLLEKREDKEL
jgi:hypothetical protein